MRAASELPAAELPFSDETVALALQEDLEVKTLSAAGVWEKLHFLKWSLLAGGVLLVLLLCVETIALFYEILAFNTVLAGLLLTVLGVFLGCMALGLYREYRQWRKLQALSELRSEGERLFASAAYGGAAHYLSEVRTLYGQREELRETLIEFERQREHHHSDADAIRQLSAGLGTKLDRQAQRLIAAYVRRLAVLTALNPLALLDSLLVLWLTFKMIRGIARIYGGRPGMIASWKLTREVALLIAAAGASDLLADSAADTIGVGIAGMVSTRLAQGVVTGLFVARIGLYALKLCRPIPLEDDRNQLWKGLRQEVFKIFDR
jgi:putative membrane protein